MRTLDEKEQEQEDRGEKKIDEGNPRREMVEADGHKYRHRLMWKAKKIKINKNQANKRWIFNS